MLCSFSFIRCFHLVLLSLGPKQEKIQLIAGESPDTLCGLIDHLKNCSLAFEMWLIADGKNPYLFRTVCEFRVFTVIVLLRMEHRK